MLSHHKEIIEEDENSEGTDDERSFIEDENLEFDELEEIDAEDLDTSYDAEDFESEEEETEGVRSKMSDGYVIPTVTIHKEIAEGIDELLVNGKKTDQSVQGQS